jgi:putative ABC transport system substrate-binding protein
MLVFVHLASAQQPAKLRKIGFLLSTTGLSGPSVFETFRQGLRELGYIEGKNIVIEYRAAERGSQLNQLALNWFTES